MSETPTWIRWETLTKRQFDRIDRKSAVVFVTCSPLEVHGPHLPLGADVLEGEGLAERTLRFLPESHRARTFLTPPATASRSPARSRSAPPRRSACSKTSAARSRPRVSRT